jgi:hypothetical protein
MDIYKNYELIRCNHLEGLQITFNNIKPLIERLDKNVFTTEIIGYSEGLVPINRVVFGTGKIKIMMWTQMHGDESTATKSVFDLFNIVNLKEFTNVTSVLLEKCTFYIIPMLNPDGSALYTRENIHGLDLNRDAKTQKNSESKILMEQINTVKPNFGFNLHDQSSYYNVEGTENVATISLLAPSADSDRSLTDSRKIAMSVIVSINDVLQTYIPNQVGRYSDTFCDNCFGDTIQSMGYPTILIESGHFPNDLNREFTRKLHTIALIQSLTAIANGSLPDYQKYFDIPSNEKRFYDKKIENVIYNGVLTSVGVRTLNVLRDGKLVEIINEADIIEGNELKGNLFHEVIDAKGIDFTKFS